MRTVTLALLLCCAPALAKPTDLERAKQHFRAAERHFDAGAYDQAIADYQAAYALVLRPALLFNLGTAYRRKAEATGDAADRELALGYYRRYLEAEPDGRGAAEARARVSALEAYVPAPAADPPPPPPAAPPLPPTTIALAPPTTPTPRSRRALRIAGAITAGAGVALLAGGVYYGLRARALADDVSGLDTAWDQALYDDGRAAARLSVIATGAGAAAVATGAVLYLVLGRDVEAAPTVSPAAVGVSVSGRF